MAAEKVREQQQVVTADSVVERLPGTKVCIGCGVEKIRDHFYRRNKRSNWITAYCKDCFKAIRAEKRRTEPEKIRAGKHDYHERNKARLNAERRQRYRELTELRRARTRAPILECKACGLCGEMRPPAAFHRHAGTPDGLSNYCKECAKAATIAWRRANPDQARVGRHIRRARIANADGHHTKGDLIEIRARQKNRCAVCSKHLRSGGDLDHIVPLSRGGSNWPKNLQWLCSSCNRSKHNRDPFEFMRQRGFLL